VANSSTNCLQEPDAPAVGRPSRSREVRQRYTATPGSAAEGELVQQHLPLVKTVVGRVAMTLPAHVDLDDLQSVGVIGLLNALRNFDEKNGASFETYARIRIHGAVMDELRRMDCVSRTVRDKARKVQTVMADLERQKGQPPTDEEMAMALKISVEEYWVLLNEVKPVTFVCLDTAQTNENGESGLTPSESIADANQIDPVDCASKRELSRLIAKRIQQLPDMQRKVLALYYFEDLRLREIAAAFGVTESRICQVHAQAILTIKTFLRNQEAQGAT
jgi:RNA polymerase sigma factor FliA